jgi:hypothetical protein
LKTSLASLDQPSWTNLNGENLRCIPSLLTSILKSLSFLTQMRRVKCRDSQLCTSQKSKHLKKKFQRRSKCRTTL